MRINKTKRNFLLIRILLFPCLFLAIDIISASAYEGHKAVTCESSLEGDKMTVILKSGEYQILRVGGEHKIEMEGLDTLTAPGRPMLPYKNLLLALPPGARVQSIEVKEISHSLLPGRYRIMPAPAILPLTDPLQNANEHEKTQEEWRREKKATYASDQAYPDEAIKLKGSGAFRKYAYASLGFCPFSYHPRSGRLIYHDTARIVLHYGLPTPGSDEAKEIGVLAGDTLADAAAEQLFINFPQIKGFYQPKEAKNKHFFNTHDYVIITTPDLVDVIQSCDFMNWKVSLGYNIKLVTTSNPKITSQPGYDLAEQIRNFLRSYYGRWGIRYVLIVGDCFSVPMRYCYPNPNNHINNWHNPYNPGGAVPTDYYYADLSLPEEVSWDSDGDGFPGEYGQDDPDFLAEVFVGRIPTSDTSRIIYSLEKLIQFEQDMGSWKDQTLHAGAILAFANQNHGGGPFADGARCPYYIESDLMNHFVVSHYSEEEGLEPSMYPWPSLYESVFINDWRNNQYGIVNWCAHGSLTGAGRMVWVWDDGDGVPETDGSDIMAYPSFVNNWSNLDDDYPSIVFAVSCSVGYPETYADGNLGVDLLTKPGFGASAGVVSASRSAMAMADWPNDLGGGESICYEFNRNMISESQKAGNALYNAKFFCNHHYGVDHYYEYMNLFGFNLYGDPALARKR